MASGEEGSPAWYTDMLWREGLENAVVRILVSHGMEVRGSKEAASVVAETMAHAFCDPVGTAGDQMRRLDTIVGRVYGYPIKEDGGVSIGEGGS